MKKSRISYLLILLLSVVYIYFDSGFLPYTIFYIVLLTPLVSILYFVVIYYTFRYSESLDKREYQKGEVLSYSLEIHNRSPFYIAYFTVFMQMEGQMLIKGMKTEHISLKPFSRQSFSFSVPILYRGKYKIGISRIEIRDFLNLVGFYYKPKVEKQISVFPRILPMEELNIPYIRVLENEYLSIDKNRGSTEISDIRDYLYGDSLKKIHWKLSSKFNKWMIKETTASTEKEFWIIINLEKLSGDYEEILKLEDRTIEVFVSLARVFIRSGVVLKVCFYKNEETCFTYSDMNGFKKLYDLFSFIPFDREVSFIDEMSFFMESMREPKSVLLFTPVFNERYLNCINKINAFGHDVSLFYCKAESGETEIDIERVLEKELPEIGIKVMNMYKNAEQLSKESSWNEGKAAVGEG